MHKKKYGYFGPPNYNIIEEISNDQHHEELEKKKKVTNRSNKFEEEDDDGIQFHKKTKQMTEPFDKKGQITESDKHIVGVYKDSIEDQKDPKIDQFDNLVKEKQTKVLNALGRIMDARNYESDDFKSEKTKFKANNIIVSYSHTHESVIFHEECIQNISHDNINDYAWDSVYPIKRMCKKTNSKFEKYYNYLINNNTYNKMENVMAFLNPGEREDNKIYKVMKIAEFVKDFEITFRMFCLTVQIMSEESESILIAMLKDLLLSEQKNTSDVNSISLIKEVLPKISVSKLKGTKRFVALVFPLDERRTCYIAIIGYSLNNIHESILSAKLLTWRDGIVNKIEMPETENLYNRSISVMGIECIWFCYYYFFCNCDL